MESPNTMDDVRAWLAVQEKSVLIDMLMAHATDDSRLGRALLLKAANQGTRGVDMSVYHNAVDDAVGIDGFIEYGAARGYAQGVEEVIDSVQALADNSELVKIFLWEDDVDGAWREAREGGCSAVLWMDLAARRESDHPADALLVVKVSGGEATTQA